MARRTGTPGEKRWRSTVLDRRIYVALHYVQAKGGRTGTLARLRILTLTPTALTWISQGLYYYIYVSVQCLLNWLTLANFDASSRGY